MRHDFFVHPEAPPITRRSPQGYPKYLAALRKRVAESPNPIHIGFFNGEAHPTMMYELIPRERTFTSWMHPREIVGELEENSIPYLLEALQGINPADQFSIHGADYGACPEGFAIQLHSLIYQREFLPAVHPGQRKNPNHPYLKAYLRFMQALAKTGALERSNIRYGIVYDTQKLREEPKLTELTDHLTSEETQIFP